MAKSAGYAQLALEPTTIRWHKTCASSLQMAHARKFRELIDGFAEWSPDKSSTPPKNSLAYLFF